MMLLIFALLLANPSQALLTAAWSVCLQTSPFDPKPICQNIKRSGGPETLRFKKITCQVGALEQGNYRPGFAWAQREMTCFFNGQKDNHETASLHCDDDKKERTYQVKLKDANSPALYWLTLKCKPMGN